MENRRSRFLYLSRVASAISVLIFCVSCQEINSNSFDRDLYGFGNNDPVGSDLNQAANQIIGQKCTSCHTGFHNTFATYRTKQDWLDSGFITQGDADNSYLLVWTINAGGNMPLGGAPLSATEYQTLVDWINE